MTGLVAVVFALTYLLIASRSFRLLPIGRPAGAMVGAVLMVAAGALTPHESYAAIDGDTIVLLLGSMLLTAYLEDAGLFAWVAGVLVARCRTPWRLLVAIAVSSAVLSALFVNDTVCVFMTPLVVTIGREARLPLGPYLVALATSANIGSAATLVGNPQNMIIAGASRMGFVEFFARAAPAAALALVANVVLLGLFYRGKLPEAIDAAPTSVRPPSMRRLGAPLAIAACVLAGYLTGAHLGYTTLAGATALIILNRRDPRDVFARVDWTLLLFFCGLFVVVHAFARTGLPDRAWAALLPAMRLDTPGGIATFSAAMATASNVVSNVPTVLLVAGHVGELGAPALAWVLLGYATTVAGNLTLVGSVANVIVAERARPTYELGFREYLRFGVPATLVALLVGVPALVLSFRLWP
jgi:Na+/H+ antiporter NhaD/arsenite permease-like protein